MSKRDIIRDIALSVLLVAPHGLSAGNSSYICRITDYKTPGSNTQNREWIGEEAMQTTVAVDRETGRVIHTVVGNTDFHTVTLLNGGSDAWSFKAIADSGAGGNVRYYEVHEYVEGPVKPFLAVSDGIAFFGQCR